MNTDVNSTTDKIHSMTDDTKALLDATADSVSDKVVQARNRLSAALAAAKDGYAVVQKKAVEGAKATDKAIRENPYQSIAIAFGVGAILGYLLSRRGER
jgi:ElaB/YqjD/DUF883 family membrane-anchored ribosome-binding protein